jgi:hypothetical protein
MLKFILGLIKTTHSEEARKLHHGVGYTGLK